MHVPTSNARLACYIDGYNEWHYLVLSREKSGNHIVSDFRGERKTNSLGHASAFIFGRAGSEKYRENNGRRVAPDVGIEALAENQIDRSLFAR